MINSNSENIVKIGNLIAYGTYNEVLSRYKYVVNFQAGDKVVSLCTSVLCPGPFRIILANLDLDEVQYFSLTENELVLNNEIRLRISPKQLYKQPKLLPSLTGHTKNTQMRILISELLDSEDVNLLNLFTNERLRLNRFQAGLRECFVAGISAYIAGDKLSFVECLKGRGIGSTPSGDDFILGHLIGLSWLCEAWGIDLHADRETVYKAALGSNPLLNTFYYQAYTLQLDKIWADFLNSLADNRVNRLMDDFYEVMDLGASSGEDMLCGFCFLLMDYLRVYGSKDDKQ